MLLLRSKASAVLCLVTQWCLTLCDPLDCSPPGSSVHRILQARTLGQGVVPFSRGSSQPGIKPEALASPALAGGFITTSATWEALSVKDVCLCVRALVTQWCLTLCDPLDCSPPGSSVHGILQARILEWVAISLLQGDLPDPGIEPVSPALAGGFFTSVATWEAQCTPI